MVDLGHALLVFLRGSLAAEDDVHLLERETLGLGHEEPDERRAEQSEQAEENVGAVGDVFEQVGRDLTYDIVSILIATKYGLRTLGLPMMKLFIQLLLPPSAVPYGRVLMGQISAIRIQAQGPQE